MKKYPEKKNSKHATVRIPKSLKDSLEKFLKSKQAKDMGFLHITDVVTDAVREFLKQKGHYPLPRFEVLNHDENGVKVIDRQLGRVVDVYIKPVGIKCLECNSSDCVHVSYVLEQPDIQKLIRKKRAEGWKLPDV